MPLTGIASRVAADTFRTVEQLPRTLRQLAPWLLLVILKGIAVTEDALGVRWSVK